MDVVSFINLRLTQRKGKGERTLVGSASIHTFFVNVPSTVLFIMALKIF